MTVLSSRQFHDEHLLQDIPLSVSIGVFDGVHRGHQLLIHSICSKTDTKSAVVTFEQNPKSFLHADTYPGDITTKRQKLKLLDTFCLDYVIMIRFDTPFSMLSGETFLSMLADHSKIRHAVVGENFHCGRGGRFSSAEVKDFLSTKGIDVEIIPSLLYDGIHTVSSTHIRQCVLSGDFHAVKRLMNRAYSLDTAEIPQYQREDAMYISTDHVSQPLPPPGRYRVTCIRGLQEDICDILIENDSIIIPSAEPAEELVFEF